MDNTKRKLAIPDLMQLGADYIGGPLVSGIEAIQKYGGQATDYVRNVIERQQQQQQQNAVTPIKPVLSQQQIDEINATPGVSKVYKKTLWDIMNSKD